MKKKKIERINEETENEEEGINEWRRRRINEWMKKKKKKKQNE